MTWATCCDCGNEFRREPDEKWKKRCFSCWKASKKAERDPHDGDECLRWYRKGYAAGLEAAEAQRTPEPAMLDAERVRQLIRLCHPDLHHGSDLAQRTTQWLLDLRRRVAA